LFQRALTVKQAAKMKTGPESFLLNKTIALVQRTARILAEFLSARTHGGPSFSFYTNDVSVTTGLETTEAAALANASAAAVLLVEPALRGDPIDLLLG